MTILSADNANNQKRFGCGARNHLNLEFAWGQPSGRRSFDQFDPSAVAGCRGERTVARDDRRLESFGKRDVHRVLCADVVAQLPRATQEIYVGVTMKIEVGEILDRFVGPTGRHFTDAHETSTISTSKR